MKHLQTFLLFALLIVCSNVGAQTLASKKWKATFGSPLDSIPYGNTVTLDTFGYLVIAGNTVQEGQDDADILIKKMRPEGTSEWEIYWNGAFEGDDFAVKVFAKGNYIYVAGATETEEGFDYVTIKFDLEGNLEWAATYDGTGQGDDFPVAVAVDNNGGVYVTGTSMGDGTGEDFATVKYNVEGIQEWVARYDYDGYQDIALAMAVSQEGEVYVAGGSSSSPINREYTIIHYSPEGNQDDIDRKNTSETASLDLITAIALDGGTGDVFVTGVVSTDGINYNVQTIKYKDDLTEVWAHTFDSDGGYDEVRAIELDPSGNVYLAGLRTDMVHGGRDMMLLKYDSSGIRKWEKTYTTLDDNDMAEAYALDVDNNGNVYVIGQLSGAAYTKTVVAMYNSSGHLKFERFPNAEVDGIKKPSDIKVTENGKYVFATGAIKRTTSYDYYIYNYETYELARAIKYPSDSPFNWVKNQILVRFNSAAFNSTADMPDDREIIFGSPSEVLTTQVIEDIQEALETSISNSKVIKAFPNWASSDSLSVSRLGDTIKVPKFWNSMILTLPVTYDENEACELLGNIDDIVFLHPNFTGVLYAGANDSNYSSSASLHYVSPQDSAHINIERAWDEVNGNSWIRVAVIDDGFAFHHQDFHMDPNLSSLGSSVFDGGFDYTNAVGLQNSPNDKKRGHGTAVAGIIGAIRNNHLNVAGIAGGDSSGGFASSRQGVSLIGLGFTPDSLDILYTHFVNAIADACFQSTDTNANTMNPGFAAHIINFSGGFPETPSSMMEVMGFAARSNVTFVAARGNHSVYQNNMNNSYPATLDVHDVVISVGASDKEGNYKNHAFWQDNSSSYDYPGFYTMIGKGLDLIAPGSNLLVYTLDTNKTGTITFTNTSAAAPHVAGTAALLLDRFNLPWLQYNNLAPEDVQNVMNMHALDRIFYPQSTGYDQYSGHGLLDAGKAVKSLNRGKYDILHLTDTLLANKTNETPNGGVSMLTRLAGDFGLPAGGKRYYATIWRLSAWVKYTVPPGKNLLSVWARGSASNTWAHWDSTRFTHIVSASTANWWFGISPDLPYARCTNYNSDSAHIEGYVYFIDSDDSGNQIQEWYPFNPNTQKAKFAYSLYVEDPSVSIRTEEKPEYETSFYPNPASNFAKLRFTLPKGSDVQLDVVDMNGKTVKSVINGKDYMRGTHTVEFDISALVQGVYTLRLQIQKEVLYEKFIKL